MSGVFVAGTDTGVSKTLVASALLYALRKQYALVVGMKPVSAGAMLLDGAWQSDDAIQLRAASSFSSEPELDNPYCLKTATSPHLAAQLDSVDIAIDHIVKCYRQLTWRADVVVVEGAGGLLVPLNQTENGADLAQALALPVVLVVGLRLGCLNHAVLTAEAIRARGLTLAGWICNRVDPEMLGQDENIAYLKAHLHAPMLADIQHMETPEASAVEIQLPTHWP